MTFYIIYIIKELLKGQADQLVTKGHLSWNNKWITLTNQCNPFQVSERSIIISVVFQNTYLPQMYV